MVVVRRFASPYSSSPSVFLLVGFVSNLDSFSSSAFNADDDDDDEEAFVDDVVFIPLAMLTVFLGPMVGLYWIGVVIGVVISGSNMEDILWRKRASERGTF